MEPARPSDAESPLSRNRSRPLQGLNRFAEGAFDQHVHGKNAGKGSVEARETNPSVLGHSLRRAARRSQPMAATQEAFGLEGRSLFRCH